MHHNLYMFLLIVKYSSIITFFKMNPTAFAMMVSSLSAMWSPSIM